MLRTFNGYFLYSNDELEALIYKYYLTSHQSDGFISGVIADYIEDNFDDLLAIGNTKAELDCIIKALRIKFNSEWHNQCMM